MSEAGYSVLYKSRSIPVVIVDAINDLIRDEIHAAFTYLWQAAVVDGWGHTQLGKKFREESHEEMDHAKKLMDRLTVFDRMPEVTKLKDVQKQTDVKSMLEHNVELEEAALKSYNKAHKLACDHDDNGTRKIFASILEDEESHFDWLKEQSDRIKQIGIQDYLARLGDPVHSVEEED